MNSTLIGRLLRFRKLNVKDFSVTSTINPAPSYSRGSQMVMVWTDHEDYDSGPIEDPKSGGVKTRVLSPTWVDASLLN